MNKVVAGDYFDLDAIVEYDEQQKCYCIKENQKIHQRLNKDSVKEAYKCGTNHIDDSQDVFVIFNFGDTRCTINLTKDVFGIVSKEINIK